MLRLLIVVLALRMAGSGAFEYPATESEVASAAGLAEQFRPHCVKVFLHAKSHEGEFPENGDPSLDVRNERPTLLGGYWLDDRRVIVEDPIIADRFIRGIEVGVPGSNRRYPARLAGRFLKIDAILLEVLPDASGDLPEAFPLRFADDSEEAFLLSYGWHNGEWLVVVDAAPIASLVDEAGGEMVASAQGVLFSADGLALGLAFGDCLSLADDHWLGKKAPRSQFLSAAAEAEAAGRLGALLEKTVLKAVFRLRYRVEEDEEEPDWHFEEDQRDPAETVAAGLAIGRRHLLVPLTLPPERVANIEEITVTRGDGREVGVRFLGSFRDYLAVLLEAEEDLLEEDPPPEFACLNPMVSPPAAAVVPARPGYGYFFRRRIDYELGWRREIDDYDRSRGRLRGYRDDPVVYTFTNEKNGALAFDLDFRLIALALTPRLQPVSGDSRENSGVVGFRPLDFLAERLRRTGFFAPAIVPVAEEAGKRLIDFGAEYQSLDSNLARLLSASAETRGGRIGLLVTHVYPGFPAAELGLREHDILLRLFIEGTGEPVELRDGGANAAPNPE
ncbi:MAG: hypothetical protein LBV15_02185, partial [Planctomycetota bacterium]|nr:hypothetical protein [Planctomycetota bacterium]